MPDLEDHLKFRTQPGVGKALTIHGEMVNLLYSQSRVTLLSQVGLLPLMAYFYSQAVPGSWVGLWLVAMLLSISWRLFVVQRYFKATILAGDIPFWEKRFVWSLVWVGLSWGVAAAWFMPYQDRVGLILSVLVLAGLSGGSMGSFGHHRLAHAAFNWPLLSPLATYWFFTGSQHGVLIGSTLLLYLTLTSRIVLGSETALRKVMSTSQDQLDSIDDLTRLTEQLANANQDLNRHESYLRAVMNSVSDGLCVIDSDGTIIGVTPSLCEMHGYAEAELIGRDVSILIAGDHKARHPKAVHAQSKHPVAALSKRVMAGEGQRKDGSTFPVEVVVTESEFEGRPIYVGLIRDVTERRAMIEKLEQALADVKQQKEKVQEVNEELAFLSTHDTLTGLPNRRYFDDFSSRMWRQTQRRHEAVSILMIDIDYFKQYNDRFGHLAGDECLSNVAEAITQGASRAGDLAARYGGEEFIVFLGNTDLAGARHIAEDVRRQVQALGIPHHVPSASSVVTVSVGIAACSPIHGSRLEQLIRAADTALYAAKASGRNRVEAFVPDAKENCQSDS